MARRRRKVGNDATAWASRRREWGGGVLGAPIAHDEALNELVRRNLRHARQANGLTLAEMSELAGFRVEAVEIGRTVPALKHISRYAQVLKLEPWQLLHPGLEVKP